MSASATHGLLLGIVYVVLDRLGSPIAWASSWAVEAIFLTIYTRLTWQRTGLLWMTLSGAHATLMATALVPASLLGFTLGNLPSPWKAIFWVNALAIPVWLLIARLVYRDQWRLWKHHMEPMSLRDMFMFRHIPHLR